MFHVVRLGTIHPALAHFTIGGLPLVVLAYAVAARRRSPAWTFVGDVGLAVTAALTLGTGVFGLVSNAVVPWPGGIETWRWVHLGFGVATTALLALAAAVRLLKRRTLADAPTGMGTLAVVLAVAAVTLFTGWVGGEVLVFHSGMAVRAAGDGALAPPVTDTDARPKDFLDAMRQARAAWGSINARLAWMLVQHPRDEDYQRIELDARRMQVVCGVMADEGAKDTKGTGVIASMSQTLGGDASDIEDAAKKKDLEELAKVVGVTSSHCASCHQQTRWKK